MTAQDWIDLMPIVADRGWTEWRSHTGIRDYEGRCPLCALAYEISGGFINETNDAYHADRLLTGMDRKSAGTSDLIDAADHRNHPLRPALMVALGMSDERAPSYEELRERNREKRL